MIHDSEICVKDSVYTIIREFIPFFPVVASERLSHNRH